MIRSLYPRKLPRSLLLVLVIAGAAAAGCASSPPEVRPIRPPSPEVPVVNLPEDLRQENWTRRGEGSCVHASTVSSFNWLGWFERARRWHSRYGGGETATGHQRKLAAEGIPFVSTERGDASVLDYATRTRRPAVIWFFANHSITFCGFSRIRGEDYALLLDNNRTAQFLRIRRETFLRRWRGYGGYACVPLGVPTPPLPFPAYLPMET